MPLVFEKAEIITQGVALGAREKLMLTEMKAFYKVSESKIIRSCIQNVYRKFRAEQSQRRSRERQRAARKAGVVPADGVPDAGEQVEMSLPQPGNDGSAE